MKFCSRSLPEPGFAAITLLTAAALLIAPGAKRVFGHPQGAGRAPNGTLSFAERVRYQRAIEEVHWRHRIWPKENPGPKPPLEAVLPAAQLERRVEDSLRKSAALEDFWGRPLAAGQLQAEMERMAQQSQQPEVLRELFQALGNDPFLIAECLARPALAERLLSQWYACDQRIHGELKRRTGAELEMHPGVEQMKQLSGEYSEIELLRSDRGEHRENLGGANRVMKLSRGEWDATLQKLAAPFSKAGAASGSANSYDPVLGASEIITVGKLSPLQEAEMRYYATAVIEKSEDRVKIATVTWRKESLDSWLAKRENKIDETMVGPAGLYTLPRISDQPEGCDDSWSSTAIQTPGRDRHTTVWTGSEMIVWGGEIGLGIFTNTGGRYTPSTDSWAAASTVNAPGNRADLTAVWTGTEMIVWGGGTPGVYFDSGGRYNPGTDTWTSTNTSNAPHARVKQTALWTGREMIVWGGLFYEPPTTPHYVNTGGKYNPSTDSWTPTSTTNAPDGRDSHTAIWTGGEMIVWGGGIANSQWVNTGGRYNPAADSWAATSTFNVPSARAHHTVLWTGNEMIVWGGYTFTDPFVTDTGGRYDPSANSWTATSLKNSPTKRYNHTAVWTGSEMIVWGGLGCINQMCQTQSYLGNGARYDPGTDSWFATSATNAPSAREPGTSVWTGSEMIVWGGYLHDGGGHYLNTGARYCAQPSTPILQGAASRKPHGNVGSFDIDLPLGGTPGVECRGGGATGDYTIVLSFLANVSVNGTPQASVTAGTGTIGSAGASNGGMVTTSGNVVTIPLTNVGNAQTIQVTLNSVNGSTNVTIPMSVLIGDVNGNGAVNATDIALTKSRSGQPVDAATFRADLTADGNINATDVALAKAFAGTALRQKARTIVVPNRAGG